MPDLSVKISELTEASSATDSDVMIIEGAETQKIKWSTIKSTLKSGDVNTLKTNDKSNLVAAINELNDDLSSIVKKDSVTLTTNVGGNANLCGLERIPVFVSVSGYVCTAYTPQAANGRNINVKSTNGENLTNAQIQVTYWYVDNK